MERAFGHLKQLRDASGSPLRRQPDSPGFHFERFRLHRCGRLLQAGTQQRVDRDLQRLAGAAHLLLEKAGYVIVNG